ncbi:MAG: DinB family protein [Vicinamibacteraceae bacterium]
MKTFARDECRTELIRRLRQVRPDSARRWGTMTAHQMICHCADACRMASGAARPVDVSTGVTRHLIKWIALYAPLPWPKGIPTIPEFDQRTAGTPPSEYAADVASLEALLVALRARTDGAAWPRHPIFGRMSQRAWLRWAFLHMDHHLRQFGA